MIEDVNVNDVTWVHRVRAAEGSALRALKEKLFTHRSELILGFQQYDHNNTGLIFSISLLGCNIHLCIIEKDLLSGTILVSEWAQVLETGLKLDLPWRTLRPRLVRLASDGRVDYQSCFEDMEPWVPLVQVSKERVRSTRGIISSSHYYCADQDVGTL